jgi:Xaa-Pro aminopeptidase
MYRKHRDSLLDRLAQTHTAAVIPTARHQVRNSDCEYRFRPTSDFWYLTGFAEPESTLVLLPDGAGDATGEGSQESSSVRSVLFLRERDPKLEIWNGRRLGVERAPEELGVDEARPITDLWKDLPQLLKGYERVLYGTGEDETRDRQMLDTLSRLRRMARGEVLPPVEMVDPGPILHELRLYKSEEELALMRRGAEITAEAHCAAMAASAPGVNECEIDALLEYTFRRRGSTGSAYTPIVAGGNNACILHYIENNAALRDGDLLLIDAGAEVDFYATDVTRTFPVNGSFSAAQREIYELVFEAESAAIDVAKPGVPHKLIHDTATGVIVRGLLRLGLLEGTEESVLEDQSFRRFFMHGTSHWLGLDVHDCGAYATREDSSRLLEPGMVFTVEPGIYIDADDETVDQRWRGIGVRIEDDVLVTRDGCEVLTAAIPRGLDEVEAACREAPYSHVPSVLVEQGSSPS